MFLELAVRHSCKKYLYTNHIDMRYLLFNWFQKLDLSSESIIPDNIRAVHLLENGILKFAKILLKELILL